MLERILDGRPALFVLDGRVNQKVVERERITEIVVMLAANDHSPLGPKETLNVSIPQ